MRIPVDELLSWYRNGLFPMADTDGTISLYSPDPRAIIELSRFTPSRSLRRVIRSNRFEIRVNTAFEEVIRRCADRDETWINEVIVESYCELHSLGFAHSVESWREGSLVGGLYGVALGGAFFGESMFHTETDASKVALAFLIHSMRSNGMVLLDTQYLTENLARYGGVLIARSDYLRRLQQALKIETKLFG